MLGWIDIDGEGMEEMVTAGGKPTQADEGASGDRRFVVSQTVNDSTVKFWRQRLGCTLVHLG